MEDQIKSGNPYWLFLTLPVFFLVWWKVSLIQAGIWGAGVFLVLYVAFVWIPDDQARRIDRKLKFKQARDNIGLIQSKLRSIKDQSIVNEVQKALPVLSDLIDTFESKKVAQGLTEAQILPMTENVLKLLTKWQNHESQRVPLDGNEASRVKSVLLKFDDLIRKYQRDGASPEDQFLTELFMTENAMQSAGIDVEGDKK